MPAVMGTPMEQHPKAPLFPDTAGRLLLIGASRKCFLALARLNLIDSSNLEGIP